MIFSLQFLYVPCYDIFHRRVLFLNFGREGLKILEFETMTEEWLDFIIACRGGEEHDYDIVIGTMANDQIYNFISDYIEGILTREQFWMLAKFKYPTHQINFCTREALKCLKFVSCEEVSGR